MALKTKRAEKAAQKSRKNAVKAASKVQDQAQKQAQKKAADLSGTAEDKANKAVSELQKLAGNAGDRASTFVDQVRPQVEDGLRAQGEKLSAFGEKVGPQAEKFRHDLQDDYLPRARRTAETTGSVVSSAVAAAVDAARGELDKGQGDIKKAAATAPAKKKSGRAGKVLLVLGLAAAGTAAGYLVWKKTRPVEDPWAPPADFARAHYPASGADETDSTQVSDAVGGAEAGDVASSLKGDQKSGGTGSHAAVAPNTPDRSSDTTPSEVKVESSDDDQAGSGAAGSGKAGSSKAGTGKAGAAGAAGAGAAGAGAAGAGAAAKGSSAKGSSDKGSADKGSAADGTEQARVIDPAADPAENPADPEKRGNHRGDS